MIEDAKKMDENKKKDTLKRMGEMADLNAIRQIKECLLKNENCLPFLSLPFFLVVSPYRVQVGGGLIDFL